MRNAITREDVQPIGAVHERCVCLPEKRVKRINWCIRNHHGAECVGHRSLVVLLPLLFALFLGWLGVDRIDGAVGCQELFVALPIGFGFIVPA